MTVYLEGSLSGKLACTGDIIGSLKLLHVFKCDQMGLSKYLNGLCVP